MCSLFIEGASTQPRFDYRADVGNRKAPRSYARNHRYINDESSFAEIRFVPGTLRRLCWRRWHNSGRSPSRTTMSL